MNNPFSSLQQFRQQFNQGLVDLLDKQQLGPFILCLANATNDAKLFEQLKAPLGIQFKQLLDGYQMALESGEAINAVEEDLLVFLKLHALGMENVQLTQMRNESHWLCQFNQLRSFRPKRMTSFEHNGEISKPFEETQFHFNKPFMAKECFWSGSYNNKKLDLFYNKYPFAELHGLIVPQRENCFPQLLNQDMHHYIWQITQNLSTTLNGVSMGYNSYGACASVNHLHFQMFIDQQGLPVSHSHWKHNGGDDEYPVNVFVSFNIQDSWQIINDLHQKNQPYNLLFIREKIFIFPRRVQGSVKVPAWSSGFTWYELSGAMLLFNQHDYNKISSADIEKIIRTHGV
jgi:ATP adenylyltransferase/5',5'''-P-1,P-4-tetraphosphate phosphorylase II